MTSELLTRLRTVPGRLATLVSIGYRGWLLWQWDDRWTARIGAHAAWLGDDAARQEVQP